MLALAVCFAVPSILPDLVAHAHSHALAPVQPLLQPWHRVPVQPLAVLAPTTLGQSQRRRPRSEVRARPGSIGPVVRARAMLVAAGAIWGSYPVLLKALQAAPGPRLPAMFIVAARFQLTTLLFVLVNRFRPRPATTRPPSFSTVKRGSSARRRRLQQQMRMDTDADSDTKSAKRSSGLAAAELAAIGFTGNFMSVWGITQVSALMGEIALGTVNVFVPLLSVAIGGACAVSARTWQGCLVSFGAVLTAALSSSACSGSIGVGAAATSSASFQGLAALLGASLLYALGRVRCQHHVGARDLDAFELNALRIGCMGVLATVALIAEAVRHAGACRALVLSLSSVTPIQWAILITSCVASGFAGSSLQYRAQKTISAAASQPFFALQPLFACGWTWLLLDEPIAPSMIAAGGLMVLGALLASTDQSKAAELRRVR